LIQAEMIEAIEQWRKALVTTIAGLRQQNTIIANMNVDSRLMIEGARALNDQFTSDARTIGDTIRRILIFGAAIGLLLGACTAILVARSITRPLSRLQHGMVQLAANPAAGTLPDSERNDELGEMARATNFFLTEIGRREQALRRAKDQADTALADLRLAQTSLIQAEKLASLGQLVAVRRARSEVRGRRQDREVPAVRRDAAQFQVRVDLRATDAEHEPTRRVRREIMLEHVAHSIRVAGDQVRSTRVEDHTRAIVRDPRSRTLRRSVAGHSRGADARAAQLTEEAIGHVQVPRSVGVFGHGRGLRREQEVARVRRHSSGARITGEFGTR
jgi:HAMP domain-containing protein